MYPDRSEAVPALRDLQETVNRMFEQTLGDVFGAGPARPSVRVPFTDVYETADKLILEMELPGVQKDAVSISFDNGLLTVTGERKVPETKDRTYYRSERWYGRFERSFRLPASVNPDQIEARLEQGILCISIPKREEAKTRQIPVTVG
ncbi:MAG TPA: Hsp20/alpha crystallin family protein [Acidobacteriota bacterium]|nr:Hsp20/alpha crystallin family protein [Acidobacteriota bacterium]HRR26380.1 Hsp20/alpha crystallin family protein [Acidobacteriota bacterium]HRR56604.1 Hsp20/alpha crystallin family protein [Acidobacteriota bacterium]HRV07174.1 Hsp20/alpha crystallin family protein [Acidobacteriota bacterium]